MRVAYEFDGIRFCVEAEAAVACGIRRAVMPGAMRAGGAAPQTTFAVRREGRSFALRRNGEHLWSVARRAELIPWVECEVMNWLLARLGRYTQLHAAAVERAGRAVLIPGAPESGKTSLACALALLGWGVMSDEVALVEARGRMANAFPRAMLVKAWTCRQLPELRRVRPVRVLLPTGSAAVRYVNPREFGPRARSRARIVALVFPEWSDRASISLLGEREALERLMSALLNGDRRPAASFEACVRLVRGARRLRLGIGDLRESARQLTEALEAE